jgi:hypothetical protein
MRPRGEELAAGPTGLEKRVNLLVLEGVLGDIEQGQVGREIMGAIAVPMVHVLSGV